MFNPQQLIFNSSAAVMDHNEKKKFKYSLNRRTFSYLLLHTMNPVWPKKDADIGKDSRKFCNKCRNKWKNFLNEKLSQCVAWIKA
jgi:hypothetical protein